MTLSISFCMTCKQSPQASQAFAQAAEDYWNHMQEERLGLQIKYGLKIHKLPDLSYDHAQSEYEFAESLLEKLDNIKQADLSYQELISFEVLKWELEMQMEGLKYFWFYIPVTPYASLLPTVHRAFTTFQFKEKEDLDFYMNLTKQYPPFIREIQNILEVQLDKGLNTPKEEIQLIIPFLSAFLKEGQSSLFHIDDKRMEGFESEIQKNFQEKLTEFIHSGINPALKDLVDFIQSDYFQNAPESVGLWQYPGGSEYYRYLIRLHTTLDLSPEEIHQIGLKYVKENSEEIEKIRNSVGFEGNVTQFLHFLKTDSRFTSKSAEEIEGKLNLYVNAFNEKIDTLFLKMPKAPYGVKRLAPELEGAMTFGYYQDPSVIEPKGIYFYNGTDLSNASSIGAESLIYHELVPGHHFEFAFHQENETLPEFHRETWYSAFSEGWAEYAAYLGLESGLYQDPYSRCGKYLADSFFAARLVVDTGMNHFQWPRSRAVKFMQENLLESNAQIHTETLRYSTDIPGQALAYKLGCLKMLELRKKVEKSLGDKFEIKKFHQAVLGSGCMPFPVLERHIDRFIQNELNNK